MAKRKKLTKSNKLGAYFEKERDIELITSGCALLDCVLGGGWAENRIVNIVGDEATGKTLLAIEACANFARKYEDGNIYYDEIESAWDDDYAVAVGLPIERVKYPRSTSVEDVFEKLEEVVRSDKPSLYIVDSLDALSDRSEIDRDIDKGTYGAQKAKKLSELFRRLVRKLEDSRATVLIISQVRDKIGAMFGKKKTRSGGRALDFYASQIVWLSKIKTVKKTKNKVERATSFIIRANCEKNKIGPPFRQCDFPIVFAYGVDDVRAGVDWLLEVGKYDKLFATKKEAEQFLRTFSKLDDHAYRQERDAVAEAVRDGWHEVEKEFYPSRRKY